MSKAKLIMDVIMYVNAKRSFTAQEVADEFSVSVRTARRYLTEISDMGVPLYTEQGRHGGYRTLKSRVLPPILFNEDEVFAIFFAFQALKHYRSLPFEVNMDSAARKMLAGFPEDTKTMISRLETVLDFWTPSRTTGSPFQKEIIESSLQHRIIRITYRSKSGAYERKVLPIGIYAQNGLWYMPAVEMEDKEWRIFRLDRIESMEPTDEVYEAEMSLKDWLASYPVTEPVRLYAELTREGARQCESIPWLENHIVMHDEVHGSVDTVIDRKDFEYAAQIFMRLGTEARLMEPAEVADLIQEKARELSRHYGAV